LTISTRSRTPPASSSTAAAIDVELRESDRIRRVLATLP
jgi:hypothetical protein